MVKSADIGRGVPLSDAAWRFGPARLKRQLDDPPEQEGPVVQMAKLQAGKYAHLPDDAQATFKALAQFGPILDAQSERTKRLRSLEDALLQKLRDGTLMAMGYPAHKAEASQRTPVEAFLFQHRYTKWSDCVFVGQGRRYELVEVFKPEWLQSSSTVAAPPPKIEQPKPEPSTPAKRKVGRPNVRSKIAEIALEIFDDPNSQPSKFKKDLWVPIREIGKVRYPDDFDDYRPKDQSMRNGIDDALKERPHLSKHHKL